MTFIERQIVTPRDCDDFEPRSKGSDFCGKDKECAWRMQGMMPSGTINELCMGKTEETCDQQEAELRGESIGPGEKEPTKNQRQLVIARLFLIRLVASQDDLEPYDSWKLNAQNTLKEMDEIKKEDD